MYFIDTETCGLVGPCVLIQYALDDGEIKLHHVWDEPIGRTLTLIESFVNHPDGVVGFNLVFDWFHLTKIYNIFKELYIQGYNRLPEPGSIHQLEPYARRWCLKPHKALDLMLHARKGKYQSTMARDNIVIRRVPSMLAEDIAGHLRETIQLPGILFHRSSKGYRWEVEPVVTDEGQEDPQFSNLVLRFSASSSLGALAYDALGESKGDWAIPKEWMPEETDWQPYHSQWMRVINYHVNIWKNNKQAQYYAWKDVDITRKLYYHFGKPEFNDNESQIACAIATARWKGFTLRDPNDLLDRQAALTNVAPTAPGAVKRVLQSILSPAERSVVTSTERKVLEGLLESQTPGVASFARNVLAARRAEKRVDMLRKLQQLFSFSGCLHPDFKPIGTKSNRLAGGTEGSASGSINPQGIPSESEFRRLITFGEGSEKTDGGDFDSFEVVIMAALYDDPHLTSELSTGKKFHALMGQVWLGMDYDELLTEENKGIYHKVKQADFAWAYGAQEQRLGSVLNKDASEMLEADERLRKLFPRVAQKRLEIQKRFLAMEQPDGIGTAIIWKEPAEYVENLFGFKRYFHLENAICKSLFILGQKPPEWFRRFNALKVQRRDRMQTPGGAAQSAIYAAAFNIQARNMRAASNHPIQSTGAEITKGCQVRFWGAQPVGIHLFRIRSMNIHDELVTVHSGVDTTAIINEGVEYYRQFVPLLKIKWKTGIEDWSQIK